MTKTTTPAALSGYLTNEQIEAGAYLLSEDTGKPIGRNAAIDVWRAMHGARTAAAPEQIGQRSDDLTGEDRRLVARGMERWRKGIAGECRLPRAGWHCTRTPGHEGPCAAEPAQTAAPEQPSEAAPLARAGWKWVPVEPTEEMRLACQNQTYWGHIDADWKAMVAAAPSLPAAAPAPTVPADQLLVEFFDQWALAMDNDARRELGYLAEAARDRIAHQPAQGQAQPVTRADYVLMPRRLTAENGAKSLLSGEFKEAINVRCHECDGAGEDPEFENQCTQCNGTGYVEQPVPVEWDTIKQIYRLAIKHLAEPFQATQNEAGVEDDHSEGGRND